MKKQGLALMFAVTLVAAAASTARAHNVWCHCDYTDRNTTIKFFHKSGEVYMALSSALRHWHLANAHLESGVLAEFDHRVDPKKNKLDPHRFKQALGGYTQMALALKRLDTKLGELLEIDKSATAVKVYEATLTKILAEERSFERLSAKGVRFADAAGTKGEKAAPIIGTAGILNAQRQDLAILRKTLDEVLDGLRSALPLAEKGEFAAVMLSGRNAFGDKMPQFTNMLSAYERFHVRTCMATITTTMQVYPKGFEWLAKPSKK